MIDRAGLVRLRGRIILVSRVQVAFEAETFIGSVRSSRTRDHPVVVHDDGSGRNLGGCEEIQALVVRECPVRERISHLVVGKENLPDVRLSEKVRVKSERRFKSQRLDFFSS